jgi:WD40 repeat protein
MVRYFIKYKGKNEYLISADTDKNVIVWDITDNFKLLHFIQTEYINHNIYSCYIFFDNWDNNFIFTSCGLNKYEKNEASYTKMYSLKDGKFEKDIIDSNENNTYYLLVWYHENYKINYLIECCEGKIIITDFFKNDLYAILNPQEFKVLKYYSGFIYNYEKKNGRDFLCCSTSNGCVAIWDLLNINLIYFGKISKFELYNIIQWNENYALISGGANKTIKIFDLKKFKEVKNIETGHSSNVNCIKKIIHPIFGESLLTSGNDHKIKLWTIND